MNATPSRPQPPIQDSKAPQKAAIDAVSLMNRQTKPVRRLLAVIVFLLGLSAATVCSLPWLGILAAALLLLAFVRSGHTSWLFLFCFAIVASQASWAYWGRFNETFTSPDLLQTILVFLILVAGFRYAELKKYAAAFNIDKVYSKSTIRTERPSGFGLMREFVRRHWAFSVIAILGSFLILLYLPPDDSYLYKYWLQPKPGRLIILSLMLFFAWFLCRTIFGLLDWIALTPQQADVAFRSWYNLEMWSEMAGVERRRRKFQMPEDTDDRPIEIESPGTTEK